jgi:Cys-tRNA(Pro)/Cys-tRNA(Cys) deacylase
MQLPVHDYLDILGIPYTTGSFPPTTAKGATEVAKAFGYAPRQMVKTLIFEVDTGEKVLVMVGGDQNAISGHLKRAIGSRNIKLAAPQTVQETTGYVLVD